MEYPINNLLFELENFKFKYKNKIYYSQISTTYLFPVKIRPFKIDKGTLLSRYTAVF